MCRFYEINPNIHFSDEVDEWDADLEDDEEGCCEDPYDDEDEEANEREWCD